MTKISNNFIIGTINKDIDERLVPMGQLTDAENISILTSEEGQKGVAKNALGNTKRSDYATQFGIQGARTIGKAISSSKDLIYNFVCGTNYDAIIEFNAKESNPLLRSKIILKSTSSTPTVKGSLNFSKSHRIKGADLISTSEGKGDLLAWTDGYNPPRIINVQTYRNSATDSFTSIEIGVIKPPPSEDMTTVMTQVVNTDGANFMRDKFLSFAYRYKYSDGYYSAISSWTEYCFLPKSFNIDYATLENSGMENATNAVKLNFNTGEKDVVEIDLLFRESGTSNVYIINKFNKENEGWSNNSIQNFTFSENKIYTVLPEAQYYRNYDNVPLTANAQTTIGSRLLYGDYTEGRDLGVVLDYDVSVDSKQFSTASAVTFARENTVLETPISNKIDFSITGVPIGGSSDRIVYNTDIFTYPYVAPDEDPSIYSINIAAHINVYNQDTTYRIQAFDASDDSLLASSVDYSGNELYAYCAFNPTDIVSTSFYLVVSCDKGMSYDAYITITTANGLENISYQTRRQYSLGKTNLSIPEYTGDIIRDGRVKLDFSNFSFKSGAQMEFRFLFQSYYEYANNYPEALYYYTLTKDYTSLNDFFTNSDIENQINVAWGEQFTLTSKTTDGVLNTAYPFQSSVVGNFLYIDSPYYSVNVDDHEALETKYEYFRVVDFNLLYGINGLFKSLHSNRDYEVALIYMDAEGRKTTALVDSTNIVNIPASASDSINKAIVTMKNDPPSWADRYKFAIKQIKGDYETIYINSIFKSDAQLGFRYAKLEGENKNKVKVGDTLIVKADNTGAVNTIKTTKVLEVKEQGAGFITGATAGLYMKVRPNEFIMEEDSPIILSQTDHSRYNVKSVVDLTRFDNVIESGTKIHIKIDSDMSGYGNAWTFDTQYTSNGSYSTFRLWMESFTNIFAGQEPNFSWGFDSAESFHITTTDDGSYSHDRFLNINITVVKFSGCIFETTPIENPDALFFETPKTYKIVDGKHNSGGLNPNVHVLNDAWNCFTWGNGGESYRIKDKFNDKRLIIDFNPTAITQDTYRQIRRFADLTYSEVLQESTNVNRLNEFNLYLANYKDNIEKSFGAITTIKGFDTNLELIQEDKYSVVYYGKDLLYNADGSTNLQKIPEVLGTQKALDGEYGNQHSDGFDYYGYDRYFPDLKRGVVMKKTVNGLIEVSNSGMNYYFTKLFRNHKINNIIGKYDQYLNTYFLNVQYDETQFVTWLFSDANNGWTTRHSFNPEDMVRLNNGFYSFKNGEIYRHNEEEVYNSFYGVVTPSSFSFNMNIEPGTRKVFRTLSLEGTDTWNAILHTDQQDGYVNDVDYQNKEGVKYAYIRGDKNSIDTATPSVQGIGVVSSINGLNVITNHSISSLISVGDSVYNSNEVLIGNITNILSNGVTLNTVTGLNVSDFIFASKGQEVETSGLLGYYMNVTLSIDKSTKTELYEVNSEVSKSFM